MQQIIFFFLVLFHGIYYTYTGCAGWANQASFPFRSGCYFRLLLLHHDQHHLLRGSIIQPSIEISAAAAAAATVRSGEKFGVDLLFPPLDGNWKFRGRESRAKIFDIRSHSFIVTQKKMCAYTYEITIVIEIALKNMPKFDFYLLIFHSFEIIDRQTRRRWCPLFYCYSIDFLFLFFIVFLVVSRDINCRLTSRPSCPPFFCGHSSLALTNGDNSLCSLCCCCSFLIAIIVQKIVPLFLSFVLLILFLIFFFNIFFSFFFVVGDNENAVIENQKKERRKYDQLLAYLPG